MAAGFDIWQEVARGGFTIAAAAIGAWLGVKVFHHQKEFDLVKQRYLEGGIDVVAAHCEQVLGIFHHNWARCLHLVKTFRDAQNLFDLEQLKQGWLELDSSQFHAVSHHRIQSLVRTHVIWEIYQLALSFAANANAVVAREIPDAIRLKLTSTKVNADVQTIVDQSFRHLKELHEDSFKFANLTRELEALANALQSEKLSFKRVAAFHERPEVKSAIKNLETQFAQELKRNREVAV